MKASVIPILGLLALASLPASRAQAEESVGDKVKDTGTDLKRDAKKGVRTAKRNLRKATGNDTVGKDIKDKVDDVGDDLDAAVTKTKRKLKSK